MRTDTIFYQLFQTFPSLLFELLGESPSLAQGYQFSSAEIKELARRFDGVFLPPLEAIEQPIYFIEVQFQPKDDFYWRFITEIFVYLGQYQPANDFLAVAIFANHRLDPGLPKQYQGLEQNQQLKVVYLDQLGAIANQSLSLSMVQLVVGSKSAAVSQTQQLLQKAREEVRDLAFQRKVIELIENILVYKFIHLSRQEIEAMFALSDLKQSKVYQEAKEEGKLEGRLEGKLEGKLETKLETVPLLLELGLTVEQVAERLDLELEIVKKVAQKQS